MTTRQISRPGAALAALTVAAVTSTLLAADASAADPAGAAATAGTADVRIHDIQGESRVSPLAGQRVADVPGIVTGVRPYGSRGFWFQDVEGDGNPATSEGVFVYTGRTPSVEPGDVVRVSGRVGEYTYGGGGSGNQSVTQLSGAEVTVVSSGAELPAPTVLDADAVPERYAPRGTGPDGSLDGLVLRPERYALDRYESLEGMNVRVDDARVVGPSSRYHDLWVTVEPEQNPTHRGGTRYGGYEEQNSGRLKVTSLTPVSQLPFPRADTGDVLGSAEGPLDYDQYGGYLLAARDLGRVRDAGLRPEATRAQRRGELAVATYNVENLDPGDDRAKFDRLAEGIVHNLAAPDIIALEEIQDDSGPEDDGTVTADETLRLLTDAIAAAGGPRYAWRGIAPQDKRDGGQPGGNIRNVFLFNPERVSFVDRGEGDATRATGVVGRRGRASLTLSPGRVDPLNPAWEDSRKPLAGEFRFRGRTVIVVANHFASKGGDQALHSRFQPPNRSSEVQRLAQARSVNAFVKDVLAVQRKANVVVLGDINDFEFSPVTDALTEGGVLSSAVYSLPAEDRYTYVFQGNAQVLDQTLVSSGIRRYDYDIVHTNAEFSDQVSDHDPQVLRFRP
ncbi:endonuclease/exonuclease/phosphatase family protein [Streptomyces sp. WMMC897]|uniref:endonuclease/exonuclease/phosphatase family protein n=1 Tax=Streptomyces sp. WMMC897 TaxID=3014782 RepID=UPI0022B70B5F|nr:endonuclease/exonuclease/phosphatase family protein [Streptomyces sp. WMMC897]MCZ7413597.1 endonuclease/exonuclease/phosphatase [Streptomyces sp. WMMC897]